MINDPITNVNFFTEEFKEEEIKLKEDFIKRPEKQNKEN